MMTHKSSLIGLPRAAEIAIALGGLLAVSPLLLIASILIKATSSGSVLFRQRRVGLNGKEFTLYKLRTMRVLQSGSLVTAAGDQRITPLGRILRKTKIDELPGLWNIIKGDMSFVGPRPEVPQLVDLNNSIWQEILGVRPGITDPITLKLRNEEDLLAGIKNKEEFYRDVLQPYKMNGYLKFVRTKNWKTDIKIIFQTIKAVLMPKSAPPPSLEEVRNGVV